MAVDTFAEYAAIVLALLMLEAVLSFDNAAILAAVVRRLPVKDRRKALMYGLVGAYVLRFLAILGAVVLLQNPWLKLVGGGYLLYLTGRHFSSLARHRAHAHHMPGQNVLLARLGVPMLWATVIQIEIIDLAFAIDQVVVAVAFVQNIPSPTNIWLIVIASFTGILFLRIAAVFFARVMDWLPLLEHMAYLAVGYVGLKLVLEYILNDLLDFEGHIPNAFSLAVTFSLFLIPIVVKLVFNIPASVQPGITMHDAQAPSTGPAAAPRTSVRGPSRDPGDVHLPPKR